MLPCLLITLQYFYYNNYYYYEEEMTNMTSYDTKRHKNGVGGNNFNLTFHIAMF